MHPTTPGRGVSLIPVIKGTLLLPVFLVIGMFSCSKSGTADKPPTSPQLATTAVTRHTIYSTIRKRILGLPWVTAVFAGAQIPSYNSKFKTTDGSGQGTLAVL
jgi:hypothetical protein